MRGIPDIRESVRTRRSVRTFDGKGLDEERMIALDRIIEGSELLDAPHGSSPSIRVLWTGSDADSLRHVGTYGVIRGEAGFLVVGTGREDDDVVDAGYRVESVILSLTGMGVGTCWLGGTFKRDSLRPEHNERDEIIPAVVPFGIPSSKRGVVEGIMRRVAGSDNRKPWSELFFIGDPATPLSKEESGPWEEPFDMVRMGPSASNRQPWRVIVDDDLTSAHLYVESGSDRLRERLGFNMRMLDAGIALRHLQAGLPGGTRHSWSFNDPGVLNDDAGMDYVATLNISKNER